MEDGVQTQPGQKGDGRDHALADGQQAQGGVGAVPDHHQLPVGEPAAQAVQHRAGPVRDRLVAVAAGLVVPLGTGPAQSGGAGPRGVRPRSIRLTQRIPLSLTK